MARRILRGRDADGGVPERLLRGLVQPCRPRGPADVCGGVVRLRAARRRGRPRAEGSGGRPREGTRSRGSRAIARAARAFQRPAPPPLRRLVELRTANSELRTEVLSSKFQIPNYFLTSVATTDRFA